MDGLGLFGIAKFCSELGAVLRWHNRTPAPRLVRERVKTGLVGKRVKTGLAERGGKGMGTRHRAAKTATLPRFVTSNREELRLLKCRLSWSD